MRSDVLKEARVLIILMLFVSAATCAGQTSKPATPAEELQALLAENRKASAGSAANDEERLKLISRGFRLRRELDEKLVALAERHPDDPVALDALIEAIWHVNTTPWPTETVGEGCAERRALDLLRQKHMASARLGPASERLAYGFCSEFEAFLRDVAEHSPLAEVRAQASLALARFLVNRADRVELARNDPAQSKLFADLFGAAYLEEPLVRDPKLASSEAESLLEGVASRYSTVSLAGGGSAADRARAELYTLRNLRVGKRAPEIEGVDQDGRQFKLSDYRGRVVLLDFWSRV